MVKKLDKLILKSFLGPFIATFFISFFVLTMQTLWKYIDDLVGKGLDLFTILQFVWYASATLSSLAMPIAILISSIMTFGNLGESFELVAIKSSGVSLLRFMRPLIWFTAGLCGITFLFANYVIPYSNLKFFTLWKDIRVTKPSFDLENGVFYSQIPGYSIRVETKEDDGNLSDVLIYEGTNPLQDNAIKSTSGKMSVSPDKNYLEFNLRNGTRYQERGNYGDTATEYIRLNFKEYKKLFDISMLQKQTSSEEDMKSDNKMLSARQLSKNIITKTRSRDSAKENYAKSIMAVLKIKPDSGKATSRVAGASKQIPDSLQTDLTQKSLNKLAEMRNILVMESTDIETRNSDMVFTKIEWHRKYAFSLACMVLFFIGAPLGSIIRKGGLGMPLVVAIIFFLLFHLLSMFGEKFSRSTFMEPWMGMWLAVICLTPVGIFFTYKAMHDSQLFNKEFYTKIFGKATKIFRRKNTNIDLPV